MHIMLALGRLGKEELEASLGYREDSVSQRERKKGGKKEEKEGRRRNRGTVS